MVDTSEYDNRITELNTKLTEMQNDKTTLEALSSANQQVLDTITLLTNQIAGLQSHIARVTADKTDFIAKDASNTTLMSAIVSAHDQATCDLVSKYGVIN